MCTRDSPNNSLITIIIIKGFQLQSWHLFFCRYNFHGLSGILPNSHKFLSSDLHFIQRDVSSRRKHVLNFLGTNPCFLVHPVTNCNFPQNLSVHKLHCLYNHQMLKTGSFTCIRIQKPLESILKIKYNA